MFLPHALCLRDERRIVAMVVQTIAAAMRDTVDFAAESARQMLVVRLVPFLAGMDWKSAEIADGKLSLALVAVIEFFALLGCEAGTADHVVAPNSAIAVRRIASSMRDHGSVRANRLRSCRSVFFASSRRYQAADPPAG